MSAGPMSGNVVGGYRMVRTLLALRDAYVTPVPRGNNKAHFFVSAVNNGPAAGAGAPSDRRSAEAVGGGTASAVCSCRRWKTVCVRVVNTTWGRLCH